MERLDWQHNAGCAFRVTRVLDMTMYVKKERGAGRIFVDEEEEGATTFLHAYVDGSSF